MNPPLPAHTEGTTTLRDGRKIGWAIYGDPEGDTVFWFHGTPGARAQLPHDAGKHAQSQGLRIVTVERPGTGDSSIHSYRSVHDFVSDLRQVADDLKVDEFGVVGLSGGGPYLLAVAHDMKDRMKVGVVLGGIGPTRGSDAVISHTLLLVPAAVVLEKIREPLGTGLGALVRRITPIADVAVDTFFKIMPGDRHHFRDRPDDRRQFTHDLIDANARSGLRSPIDDLIVFGRYWGFELSAIQVPIIFYGGNSDIIVPYFHAERQSKRVPDARLRTFEGRGHFAGYTSPDDIFDDIRAIWPATSNPDNVRAIRSAPGKKAPAKKAPAKKAPAKRAAPRK